MSYFLSLLHKYYPLEVMKKLEVKILKNLDYKLNYYNIFHFVLFFINNGALQNEITNTYKFDDDLIQEDEFYLRKELVEQICFICENVVTNKSFILNDNLKLACSIILLIRELNNITPNWPLKFEDNFNIKLNDFASEYEKLKMYIRI
jgi:hypothetical protein